MSNNILVIDDNTNNFKYIKSFLESKNVTFLSATTTEKAQDILHDNSIDLIFIDISSKPLNAKDFILILKNNIKLSLIPIIVVGKNILQHQKLELIKNGAFDVFELPFNALYFDAKTESAMITSKSVKKFYSDHSSLEKDKSDFFYNERLKISKELSINLAHQIKDHFNYILTSSQSLANIKDANNIKKCANKITHYASDALNILNFMIEQTSIGKPYFQICSISNIINNVLAIVQNSHNNISFFQNTEDEKFKIDQGNLSKTIINILENSCEAILMRNNLHFKGIIEINGYIKNSDYFINIKDNGIGIHNEMMGKIFNPFFSTKENHQGMGLTFARQIIESSHKGKILIESIEGKETSINIILPIKK